MATRAGRILRRSTAPWRSLPALLGIGAMRGGTKSLFTALSQHPDVVPPTRKEVHFFDIHYERGLGWYRAFFPLGERYTIDISPSYMSHEESAARAATVIPNAKVVALLRDPSERALSHYRYRRSKGVEPRSFEDAIDEELAGPIAPFTEYRYATEIPYLTGGMYAPQLEPWFREFGDSLLVIDSADLFAEPSRVYGSVIDFAGLAPTTVPFPRTNTSPPGSGRTELGRIREFFLPYDEELSRLTGRRHSWMPDAEET